MMVEIAEKDLHRLIVGTICGWADQISEYNNVVIVDLPWINSLASKIDEEVTQPSYGIFEVRRVTDGTDED